VGVTPDGIGGRMGRSLARVGVVMPCLASIICTRSSRLGGTKLLADLGGSAPAKG
jgi:hypothetical protein